MTPAEWALVGFVALVMAWGLWSLWQLDPGDPRWSVVKEGQRRDLEDEWWP